MLQFHIFLLKLIAKVLHVKALAAVCQCVSVCVLVCHGYEFDRVPTCVAEDKPGNLCLSQSEKYNAVTHSENGCAKTQGTLSIMEINSCHCNLRK